MKYIKHIRQNLLHLFFIAVTIFYSNCAGAATYYFSSSSGNDEYTSMQSRNPLTPWKSIEKLNSFFKYLGSGDSVLFKRGEVFYGSIVVNKSGSVFAPIIMGAYGKGNKPEISGFTQLNNWTLVKKGVYETPCVAFGNNLVINGAQQVMGRYPNKGYITYQSHNSNSSITDNQLSDVTNWTGAELVIRKNRWIIDRSEITDQNKGTLTYSPGTKAMPTNGYGYFIQNDARTLDQAGEWYYDRVRKSMMVYFGLKNPAAYHVKTSAANNLVDIKKYNYINFEDLSFTGAGNSTFNIVQSKNIIIKNCSIDLCGGDAVSASYSPFIIVENTTINHSLNGGINLDDGCINSSIINNLIKNVGLIAGLGKSGSGTYEAITSFGDNTRIIKNRIDSIGYNGVYFGGNASVAKNNYISYFCLTKDDGAGIYIGDWAKTANKKVLGNIVLHGVGNYAGTGKSTALQAEGIYIDDNSESVFISDNTVALCANNGIKIHNAKDILISNNTVVNNGVQLRMEQDHYLATSTYIRNNQVRNNTFFSSNTLQHTAKYSTHQDDIDAFGQIDSNYYCQPQNELLPIITSTVKNGKDINQIYNLANWKSAYGKDNFSTELAATNSSVLFEYNASTDVKTIVLSRSYVDVHNNVYKGKININPYSSIILVPVDEKFANTAAIKNNSLVAASNILHRQGMRSKPRIENISVTE